MSLWHVVRLLRRLAADPTLPRGVRIRLTLLLVYLAVPIALVPDFIPVVGSPAGPRCDGPGSAPPTTLIP